MSGRLLGRSLFRTFAATPQGSRLLGKINDSERLVDSLQKENLALRRDLAGLQEALSAATDVYSISDGQFPYVPNGHFYSPIPSLDEVQKDLHQLFPSKPRRPAGIDLRDEAQLDLLRSIGALQNDNPFSDQPSGSLRYGYDNPAYSYGDALFLNGMLRLFRPKRIIEVGSGHSSCMTLDTNDIWLDGSMNCTFIEPYPDLLHSLIGPGDADRVTIVPKRVQDVGIDVFRELKSGDVLFIDSTHVSKIGSDVNFLFLEVLPALDEGVLIHVHDIFYPFEYPLDWILAGRVWNEMYMLMALLQQGGPYQIVGMNSFLALEHPEEFRKHLPLALKNPGGSIWLRKIGRAAEA